MPIYAYKCQSCGHSKDVLQKMSDSPLTACPACGASTFAKQVTAAGFQLKGSGWYVTDFRGGSEAKAPATGAAPSTGADSAASTPTSNAGAASSASAESGSGSSASATPAAGCSTGCACH